MKTIVVLASLACLAPGTISATHSGQVTLKDLMRTFAAQENFRWRFVGIPWQLAYWLLRSAFIRLRLSFRTDSLRGLIYIVPSLKGREQLARLRITLHTFEFETIRDSSVPSGGY